MKKNLGVSMISLVITIIVIIILAAVAFGSSTDTIENANFSNFANNIAEVQNLLDQKVVALKGIEGKNGVQRTDAQVYNYVAKGATLVDKEGLSWLPRLYAEKMHCTLLSGDMNKIINYELPEIKTSTIYTNSIKCSYFVTKTGTVFIWPPYIYNDELYVNGATKLVDENGNSYTPESGEVYIQRGDTSRVFSFNVDGIKIVVGGQGILPHASAAIINWLDGNFGTVNDEIIFIEFPEERKNSQGIIRSPGGVEALYMYKTPQ